MSIANFLTLQLQPATTVTARFAIRLNQSPRPSGRSFQCTQTLPPVKGLCQVATPTSTVLKMTAHGKFVFVCAAEQILMKAKLSASADTSWNTTTWSKTAPTRDADETKSTKTKKLQKHVVAEQLLLQHRCRLLMLLLLLWLLRLLLLLVLWLLLLLSWPLPLLFLLLLLLLQRDCCLC